MKIKVISYGKRNNIQKAMIILRWADGTSSTRHVWKRHGNVYGDMYGNLFNL